MTVVREKKGRGRPKKIRIPARFSMLGHEVEIIILADPEFDKVVDILRPDDDPNDYTGLYDHNLKNIYIRDSLSERELYSTYLHERSHCLMCFMGQDELNEDEGFVDLLGELEYQYLTTMRGNLSPKGKYDKQD